MITVWQTFSFEEEVIGGLFVEVGLGFGGEWAPSNMEASFLCLFDPVSPEGTLEAVGWPVPGILGLNDVELAVETEGFN